MQGAVSFDKPGLSVLHVRVRDSLAKDLKFNLFFHGCDTGHADGRKRVGNLRAVHIQNAANPLIFKQEFSIEGYARLARGETTLSLISKDRKASCFRMRYWRGKQALEHHDDDYREA